MLPGYIHPDEFFQSPEIMGESVLGFEVFKPWEFEQSPQCRSIVIPNLYSCVKFESLIYLDYVSYTIADSYYPRNTLKSLLVFASSYTLLIYHTRSFSNTVESILLALCFIIYIKGTIPYIPLKRKLGEPSVREEFLSNYAFLLGFLLALGCFTRITFILYAFPIGLAFLHHIFISTRVQQRNWTDKILEMMPACLGFVLTTILCVLADSLYFGSLIITFDNNALIKEHIFILLNNPMRILEIAYNINSDNLAEHGIHPRYLHILNFVLLFGPLVLLTMKDLNASFTYMRFKAKSKYKTVIIYSGLCGLLLLSIIPHQEPRFLLPLFVPVIIVPSDRLQKIPRLFWVAWAIFNLICAVFYGGLHQAGIIPIIQKLQYQSLGFKNCEISEEYVQCNFGKRFVRPVRNWSETFITNVIFYKTYMPPRHLFGYPKTWRNTNIQLNIYDLAGKSIQNLEELLLQQVAPKRNLIEPYNSGHIIFQQRLSNNITLRQYERTLLVTPSTTDLSSLFNENYSSESDEKTEFSKSNKFGLALIDQQWPHLNLDQIDRVFSNGMFLNVYAFTKE
ncbi:1778_t:CDS:10 [Diversispora eburnea]|uniref:Mannosyltransferase n=1 Tax=Diversispora eburnea TaxID=1213867 RepID=A0A9N8UYS5_9GLOM|nr:1778_t:CDS:10 [Diversispora eburnea]